ncbi:MAG TPA: capsid cement protein [Bryobacteraceae bacterium]|nr:capsid cement protein [Bryobacteraceae bacterium]
MAYEQTLRTIAAPASADLSASQFCFVVVNSSGQLALPSAGGEADGILQDKPNAQGVQAELAVLGVSKVVVGTGGVTAGDLLATDANGKAVTAASGNKILGRALATGAAGVIIPALIQQKGKL